MAPFVVARFTRLYVEAHHLGDAPQNPLAEPACRHVFACARAKQQIAIAGYDTTGNRKLLALCANERPDQSHRRARHGAAADTDRVSIVHEGCRFLERNDLLAEAPVALREVLSQLAVGSHHAHVDVPSPTSALNS